MTAKELCTLVTRLSDLSEFSEPPSRLAEEILRQVAGLTEAAEQRYMDSRYSRVSGRKFISEQHEQAMMEYDGSPTPRLANIKEFKEVCRGLGKVNGKDRYDWWVYNTKTMLYRKIVFWPFGIKKCADRKNFHLRAGDGVNESWYYNEFRGWPVTPAEGDWSHIQDFLLNVICSGDQRDYDYLLRWLAFIIKCPEIVDSVPLVLVGDNESAKSMFSHLLTETFKYLSEEYFGVVKGKEVAASAARRLLLIFNHTIIKYPDLLEVKRIITHVNYASYPEYWARSVLLCRALPVFDHYMPLVMFCPKVAAKMPDHLVHCFGGEAIKGFMHHLTTVSVNPERLDKPPR